MEGQDSIEFSCRRSPQRRVALGLLLAGGLAVLLAGSAVAASPQDSQVSLGTAANFAVLAGTPAVTNAGVSTITGKLGIYPGSGVTGFPPGQVVNGTIEASTQLAATAKQDLAAAYASAVAAPCTYDKTGQTLGGQTLTAGTYCQSTAPTLTGALTLSGNGVFVFQVGSTLVTAAGFNVVLSNGADACNVYWQVGSSATIAKNTTFAGTIMAYASITVDDGAQIAGRLLAQNGNVTLIHDVVTVPSCAAPAVVSHSAPPPAAAPSRPSCVASACSTSAPPPLADAAVVTAPTPGPALGVGASTGGGGSGLGNVDMAVPVQAANLAPAPILDTHHFPWLWPLLIGLDLLLFMAIAALVRRTHDADVNA